MLRLRVLRRRISSRERSSTPMWLATRLGELRDVQAAGYPNFLGMAGLHRFFHTPADDLRPTSPEILEPVARAFADAVRKAAERGERAFKENLISASLAGSMNATRASPDR